jgi:hypothetical protein
MAEHYLNDRTITPTRDCPVRESLKTVLSIKVLDQHHYTYLKSHLVVDLSFPSIHLKYLQLMMKYNHQI